MAELMCGYRDEQHQRTGHRQHERAAIRGEHEKEEDERDIQIYRYPEGVTDFYSSWKHGANSTIKSCAMRMCRTFVLRRRAS